MLQGEKETHVERIGAGRRLAAAILDWIVVSILIVAGISIYSTVRGAELGAAAQRAIGMPVTMSTIVNGDAWEEYGSRAEELVADIERMVEEDFTQAQLEEMGDIVEEHWEGKFPVDGRFTRDTIPFDFVLSMDEDSINEAIDDSFDAVIAAESPNLPSAQVNALRNEVKTVVGGFGAATLLPMVINFVVWLAFLPTIIWLLYGLIEGIFGRSIGKLIMGIGIKRADGDRAYSSTLLLRYAVKYSSALLMILAILLRSPAVAVAAGVAGFVVFVGMLVILGPEKRALYDFIAGTAVYRANAEPQE